MKQQELRCNIKPYIQPFERVLALRELEALTHARPLPMDTSSSAQEQPRVFQVLSNYPALDLADRLTYWESVEVTSEPGAQYFTRQVRREATTNLVRNGITAEQLRQLLPFRQNVPLPNHRNLRYGPHGIHEYRGKFFPQLVRSLLNVAGTNQANVVLDPMCGSGTTLVEAALMGCKAIGIDLNPLSVLMSEAKCDILTIDPGEFIYEYASLKRDLLDLPDPGVYAGAWFESLPKPDQEYLFRWFSGDTLAALDPIAVRVSETSHPACRKLFTICLSNILRRVSWQKNDDLRVRKEVQTDTDVLTEFLAELNRSARTVLALLFENRGVPVGEATIFEGDARKANEILAGMAGKVDIIITSPPYATALPYLDTDRLSLSYLGLLSRTEHRRRDFDMIGNREITTGQRQDFWRLYGEEKAGLTQDIVGVIDRIAQLNENTGVGFRRQNLPSLLARYFLDMRQLFKTLRVLLRTDAPAYVVVGNNHTIAGTQRVDIETNQLLAELGESVGLSLTGTISMEMLQSRDIFKRNAGNAETILEFRNV